MEMNASKITKVYDPIMVDIKGLQEILGVGKNLARDIGRDAGAEIRFSERLLRYDVEKVREYVRSLQHSERKARGGGD